MVEALQTATAAEVSDRVRLISIVDYQLLLFNGVLMFVRETDGLVQNDYSVGDKVRLQRGENLIECRVIGEEYAGDAFQAVMVKPLNLLG